MLRDLHSLNMVNPFFCYYVEFLSLYPCKQTLGFLEIHGTFDKKDIVAALISGLITYVIKEIAERKKKNNKINSNFFKKY